MTITLTPEIERALTARAAQQCTTPELLALHDLRGLYVEDAQANGTLKIGADLLALWEQEGAFLPREDLPDSPTLARQIREQVQQVRKQERGHADVAALRL